jgi:hypothetical protein
MRAEPRLLLRHVEARGRKLFRRVRDRHYLYSGEQLGLPVGVAMTALALGCRAMLAVVMFAAVAGKLRRRDFALFVDALRGFGVPAALARVPPRARAGAVVALEAAAAVLLVVAPAAGLVLSLGLIAMFTVVLRSAVRNGREVACRCFGASTAPVGVAHLVRNGLLLAVIGAGVAATALAAGAEVAPPERLAAIALGVLAGAAVTRWDDLVYLVAPQPAGRR